jgi:D-glycero-D-manno-heptose 1,7-bisphosphate phosphatase
MDPYTRVGDDPHLSPPHEGIPVVTSVTELHVIAAQHRLNHHYLAYDDPDVSVFEGSTMQRLLVIDMDGTVRKGYDELGRWVNGPEDVEVFPDAVERLKEWRAAGGKVIGVSNQGGIGLGHVTDAQVEAAMIETQRQLEGALDRMVWCKHAPGAGCWCRKPAPGAALQSILSLGKETGELYPPELALVVGDRPEDQGLAAMLGFPFQEAGAWRAGQPS